MKNKEKVCMMGFDPVSKPNLGVALLQRENLTIERGTFETTHSTNEITIIMCYIGG